MQNSREVIDALLRRKKADRVGVMDSPWEDTLRAWVQQGMPADDKGKAVDSVEHFDFDMAGCGGWFDWYPKRGVRDVVEETEEWQIIRHGTGASLKWWKNKSGTPEHVDFDMTTREKWESDYKPLILKEDPARVDVKGAAESLAKRRAENRWTHYGHCHVWEFMRGSMGDYTMYTSLLTDPDWIHDYNRTYTDFAKACYKRLFDEAGIPDGIWMYEDLGYKQRLFTSPKVLGQLIFPYYAELVAFFHSYGLPVILHTCGYTEPALDLIVEAGFDGLNPMEVKAGNDPLRIAEKYGDKLAFVGGLDARILESGDRDVIRKGVTDIVEGMKQRGARYVFASDHSLSTNIRYDDYRYALEVYREHMMY